MYKVATTSHDHFEKEKNKKALLYTIAICVTLLLLFFVIRFKLDKVTVPIPQDLIEVNLGNDAEGFGEEQPLIKGEMAPSEAPAPTPQQAATPIADDAPSKDITPDDNAEEDAAPVTKPIKTIPKAVNPPKENTTKPIKSNNPTPVVAPPAPTPKKPKFTYNGPGKGGGNGATQDNGYRNQGNNPGGTGDAGSPGGKADSYGNNPGGRSGVSVQKGVKPLNLGALRFEDEFNENAKVYVDVKYNGAGTFLSATVVKPTTTTNSTILAIARRKAAQLKFPASDDGGVTTILLNFKVQN